MPFYLRAESPDNAPVQQLPAQYGAPSQPSHAAPGQVPGRVEVKVSYSARLGCAFTAAAVLLIFSIVAFASWFRAGTGTPGGEPTPTVDVHREFPAPLLAFPLLGFVFLIIPLVLSSEKSSIPRYLDPTGVTMRSGRHFPWSEYRGVQVLNQRTRSGFTYEVGITLMFASGSATVRYRPITNKSEVLWITGLLKQHRNPWG